MILRGVVLVLVWVLLQGELSVGNLVGGVLVVATIEVLFPMSRRSRHRMHPFGAAVFVGTLLRDLVVSSSTVVMTVLRPTPDRAYAEVIPVTLSTQSRLVTAIVANAISLTPGTLTVDVAATPAGYRLDVHALGRVDHDDFVASIGALERRVLRAVEPLDPTSRDPDEPTALESDESDESDVDRAGGVG